MECKTLAIILICIGAGIRDSLIKAIEDGDGIESAKERGIAIQSAGGFINLSGLDNNETVSFYALDGKALGTAKSIDGNVSFSAKQGTVVVARIGKESVKIAVE